MPEGVQNYPRWEGELTTGPAFPVIALQEMKRAWDNPWVRMVLIVTFAYGLMYVGQIWSLSQRGGGDAHTMDNFLQFLYLLPWATLAVAAAMSGPALLSDQKHGALELYLSRAVTRWDYLGGKIVAVLALTSATILVPALTYFLASYAFFESQPENWLIVPAGVLGFAVMWALMIAGLGLGLSCVARSSRAATLTLFGGFAVLHAIMSSLLSGLTRDTAWNIISPFYAIRQQSEWLFREPADYGFPTWWGLVLWGGLVIVGWGLVWWKHPRIRGEDNGRS